MRRYLLFIGPTYYPDGGINDLIKDSDNLDELRELALTIMGSVATKRLTTIVNFRGDKIELSNANSPWWHIFDSQKIRTILD